jgi:hypothetical protein
LPYGQYVKREFQQDVSQTKRQQKNEAVGVVIEVERGRTGARGDHDRQTRLRYVSPANDVGLNEPVQVVIGVDEGQKAGQPGFELEIRNPEQLAEGRSYASEAAVGGTSKMEPFAKR